MKKTRAVERSSGRRGEVVVLLSLASLAWAPLARAEEPSTMDPAVPPPAESTMDPAIQTPVDPTLDPTVQTPAQPLAEPAATPPPPSSAWIEPAPRPHSRAAMTDMKAANIRVGGGVEGLGLTLDNRLTTGPLWSAAAGLQPLSWMGVELGYSGSTHEVDSSFFPVGDDGAVAGADFVRNGGQVAVTVNAPLRFIQPYALAGIGIDNYNWRGDSNIGFKDDTSGRVPLGGGVKGSAGPFVADVRFNYNVLFDQQFARLGPNDQIGSTWDLGAQIGGQF